MKKMSRNFLSICYFSWIYMGFRMSLLWQSGFPWTDSTPIFFPILLFSVFALFSWCCFVLWTWFIVTLFFKFTAFILVSKTIINMWSKKYFKINLNMEKTRGITCQFLILCCCPCHKQRNYFGVGNKSLYQWRFLILVSQRPGWLFLLDIKLKTLQM